MQELLRDRKKDLTQYGKDPYINPFDEKTKFLKDLKIYMSKGYKHQFDDYKDVAGEPDSPVFFESFANRAKSLDVANQRLKIDLRGFEGRVSFLISISPDIHILELAHPQNGHEEARDLASGEATEARCASGPASAG